MKLLTTNNHKTIKGEALGYHTAILHLAPHYLSGHNVCPFASNGCSTSCLNTAGFGQYNFVQKARIKKTKELFKDMPIFMDTLKKEIAGHNRRSQKLGLKPAIRLNGTSDLPWENMGKELFKQFPDIQFYDYCKSPIRMKKFLSGKLPSNYHLTFSRSETNWPDCKSILALGGNVAAVFSQDHYMSLQNSWATFKVIDGEKSDLRFLDKRAKIGYIIALKAKGKAKQDRTGFVIYE